MPAVLCVTSVLIHVRARCAGCVPRCLPYRLWQNNVGNEGCAYLMEGLQTNSTLTNLNLKANRVEVDFEDAICEIVEKKEFEFNLQI